MVLTRDQFFDRINDAFGDESDENAISFIEDMSDTYNALEERANSDIDWEKRYKENDEAWRKKYKNRFFTGSSTVIDNEEEVIEKGADTITIDDLFEEV